MSSSRNTLYARLHEERVVSFIALLLGLLKIIIGNRGTAVSPMPEIDRCDIALPRTLSLSPCRRDKINQHSPIVLTTTKLRI